MKKKNILFAALLILSETIYAQWHTVENPPFKLRNGSIYTPTKIEIHDDYTRVYCHVVFRPGWWISYEKEDLTNEYLQDTRTGEKYLLIGIEGMELDKRFTMPPSGEHDVVKIYKSLPKDVRTINILNESENSECSYWGIELYPTSPNEQQQLISTITGNWLTTDGHNRWEYGIYDSLVVYNHQWWYISKVCKKGKSILLDLQNKSNKRTAQLKATPKKGGNTEIQMEGRKGLYNQTASTPYLYPKSETGYHETAETFFK